MSGRFLSPISKLFMPAGVYEQVIARTKYFDEALKVHSAGAEQVLIFGAGFDSRAIRLRNWFAAARVFEVDAPTTQRVKTQLLQKRGIRLPLNLLFVPVDFETDSLAERLSDAGFRRNLNTIFVLEGLTMYLNPTAIDGTFRTIGESAGKGSILIVDFSDASVRNQAASIDRRGELFYASKAGEQYVFGMDEEEIPGFLQRYGFEPTDISNSRKLESRFFPDHPGSALMYIRGRHSTMVTATRS